MILDKTPLQMSLAHQIENVFHVLILEPHSPFQILERNPKFHPLHVKPQTKLENQGQ
jgi:hypothetical protein